MDSETLNEYIFAAMVFDKAQSVRRRRLNELEAEGAPAEELNAMPLIREDIQRALANIEWARAEMAALRKA